MQRLSAYLSFSSPISPCFLLLLLTFHFFFLLYWTIGGPGNSLSFLAICTSFQMFWIFVLQETLSSCLSLPCVHIVPVCLSLCVFVSFLLSVWIVWFQVSLECVCVVCPLSKSSWWRRVDHVAQVCLMVPESCPTSSQIIWAYDRMNIFFICLQSIYNSHPDCTYCKYTVVLPEFSSIVSLLYVFFREVSLFILKV